MNIKLSGLFAVVLISSVMFFNGLCTAGIRSWDKADSWNLDTMNRMMTKVERMETLIIPN